MHEVLFILDLVGTFAFASFATYLAQKKGFDIFGIGSCAFISALGGGTLREVILNKIPFYFYNSFYFYVIILAILFTVLFFKKFHKLSRIMLYIDAIGLSTFAYIGATRASQEGLGAIGIIFIATLTAVGGGLIRDISIGETPQIFYKDFYASPAIILGVLYFIFNSQLSSNYFLGYLLIFAVFLIRVLAIEYKIDLWSPSRKVAKKTS